MPDPAAALLWLRRVRNSVGRLSSLQRKCRFWSIRSLLTVCLVGWLAGSIFGGAILSNIIESVWGPVWLKDPFLTVIPALGFVISGALSGYVVWRLRATHYRKQRAGMEAIVGAEALEVFRRFPNLVSQLVGRGDDLTNPEVLDAAIEFLERQEAVESPVAVAGIRIGGHSLRAHEMPRPAPCSGQVIGGCRLVKKLGEGGMGAAYEARHLGLDIPVVVKVLHTELTRQGACVDRFVQEARAAAKLKHPNIVGVYNVGCEAGVYFIVMEFVESGSLQEMLTRKGRLPPTSAVKLVGDVCRGLQYAHENEIVHRDIKPANILLNASGVAKIADLGLAKRLDEDFTMTQSGMIMGTPYYLSPEQAADAKHADHRADIYSLGCMFYEMVCGKVPYAGDTLGRIILAHAQAPIPDPRVQTPGISERLANMIVKMMAKRPADRFQSAKEVLDALSQAH